MTRTLLIGTLSLLSFIGVFTVTEASTTVSGIISTDTTWTLAGSPYVVASEVSVPGGVTLTIEPGAIVTLSDSGSITASGTITAIGTQANPITITATLGASGFGTLDVKSSGSATFTYTNISSIFSLSVDGATLHFTDSALTQSRQGLLASHGASVVLDRYELDGITGSGIKGSTGASIVAHSGRITNVNMTNGFGPHYGVLLETGATGEFNDLTLAHCYCPGITVNSGSVLSIASSTIFNTGGGRGIFLDHASSTIRDLTLSSTGDGIVSSASTLTLGSSTLRSLSRGALSLLGHSTTTARNLTIVSTVQSAITLSESFLDLDHATLSQIAGSGAVSISSGARAVIASTTFKNSSSFYGILLQSDTPSLVLTDSTITGFTGPAIYADKSQVAVTGSTITGNGIGIDAHTASGSPTVSIHDSTIMNNTQGIVNTGSAQGTTTTYVTVDARNNWWGTLSGPQGPDTAFGTGNPVSAHVDVVPLLIVPPGTVVTPPPCTVNCNSNVMFLPGFMGSRLYRSSGVFGETRIWDAPLIRSNQYLFMNPDGTPANPGIYTKDVIDESYGANVYKNFLSSMDTLVTDGSISGWETLPYDWRNDVHDVVNNPVLLPASSYSMVDEVIRMASSSRTGRVTLVGHSNGGLVGKALIQKLVEMGKGNLVDKFIMVAVPQLGTPKAVSSLLHGDGLPIDNLPLLLSKGDARTLGENMPSTYSLLPSEEYLTRVLDPVVVFDSGSTFTNPYIAKYGIAITHQTELRDFLITGVGGKPSSSDFLTPNKLNAMLYDKAVTNHATLDSWKAPISTEVIQIAGWGLDTPSGVRYFENSFGSVGCVTNCAFLDHDLIFSNDGDGTVVSPSATASTTARTYYLDIAKYNDDSLVSRSHLDILDVKSLRDFIKDIVLSNNATEDYISQIRPNNPNKKTLRLKVHSPVTLDIYDGSGRHTGVSTSSQSENGRVIDRQIPNSYYLEVGEGKYAGVSFLGTTTVKLFGTDTGTFTLEVEELSGNIVVGSTSFSGIPVSTSSVGVIGISSLTGSSSPVLTLDVDGDGQPDAVIAPGVGLSPSEVIGLLRGAVKALHLPAKKEEKLLKKVDKLELVLQKEFKSEMKKKVRISRVATNMTAYIQKLKTKNLLTDEDVADLLNIIGQIGNVGVK